MDPSNPETTPSQTNDHQHIRLACQACQRKKIKCDRTFPCGQCQRSNLDCLPSTRKPRARHATGKRAVDSELRNRISKLESLVETLSGEVGVPEDGTPEEESTTVPVEQDEPMSPTMGKYIGSPFWATLTGEVQALRDALEEDDASEEEPSEDSPASGSNTGQFSADHDLLICPPASVYVMPGALPEPPAAIANQLYDIFIHNVDKVFKVFHRPTLKRFLDSDEAYLGYPAHSPPNNALRAAMWFSAVITLNDNECFGRFRMPRDDLINLYRRHVDVALAHADLINTRDLATLQAFVISTAASRIIDQSRRPWTMTGLVVRIAFGMGLHREIPTDSPYVKETKRRLWHMIRVLDAFGAVDRGTELLIGSNSFDTPLPSNVNDSDFDENSTSIISRDRGLCDTTFNLMAHAATSLTMHLLKPETPGTKGETWQQRLDLALDLGKEIREKYLQYCDDTVPFQRFLKSVGNSMAASSVLRAVRPMQKHVSSVPPRVDSPFVLQLAVNSLRESEATHQDPEAGGWRWIFWVQWHALAVALAGLCSIRDTELADTAWTYVEKSYERHSRQVADTKGGMLWKPIEKLYKKASAFRDGTTATSHSTPSKRLSNIKIDNGPMQPQPWISAPPAYQPMPNGQATLPPGGMPTSGVMNAPMDVNIPMSNDAGFATGLSPMQGGGMTWMDWERIMEDINMLNPEDALGNSSVGPQFNGMQANGVQQYQWQ